VYTPWVNVLDYTAIVVPVTKVDAAVDKKETNYDRPLGETDKAIHDECE
jgi:amidase